MTAPASTAQALTAPPAAGRPTAATGRGGPPGRAARPRLAVVGAGWAGLAAAVQAVTLGAEVTLFEMAHSAGGRARTLGAGDRRFDNGQHILIGAYSATLALMRQVGAEPDQLLWRGPLALTGPDGQGLVLPAGPALPAFVRGVLRHRRWRWRDKLALLQQAARWQWQGFDCPAGWTVQRLCRSMPPALQHDLIDPLCVAALNTPMATASAQVFLRVLRDALFSGPGSADLLLPRAPLSALLPEPALAWLAQHGAQLRPGHRVQQLASAGGGWQVDGLNFDRVVLACPAPEAARLAQAAAPAWAETARALVYEPIATVWLRSPGLRLAQPMVALPDGPAAPAQFVFDLQALGHELPAFAFVVSAATPWLGAGLPQLGHLVQAQAAEAFGPLRPGAFSGPDSVLHLAVERRATFACTPGLARPAADIAPGLMAAGDHVQGPYPATLEGAVRAGQAAAHALL